MILCGIDGMMKLAPMYATEGTMMDNQDILQQLAVNTGTFPREAVEQAIAQRERITPALLRVLEDSRAHMDDLQASDDMAYIFAMYLLAQFREPRAYPLIVAFFSVPGDLAVDATGDVVTEDLGRILASVSCGDISLMTTVIENPQINEYVRTAALRGLVTLVACGERSRDDIMIYFQQLFRGKLVREAAWVWAGLVAESAVLYPEEVYEDIRHAFDEGLIEPRFMRLEDIEATLHRGKEQVLDALRQDPHYRLITDTISEVEWWASFHPEEHAACNVVAVVPSSTKKPSPKSKDKHKRKLAKAARRRNRR